MKGILLGVVMIVGFLGLEAAFLFHAALPVNAGLLRPERRAVTARKAPVAPVAPATPCTVTERVG